MRPTTPLLLTALLGLSVALGLCGCVSNTRTEEMVAELDDLGRSHLGSVSVRIELREPSAALRAHPTRTQLQRALEETLLRNHLFERVAAEGAADYRLRFVLERIDAPSGSAGLNFHRRVTAEWALEHVATGEALFSDRIESSYVATVGDALAGPTRETIAVESAVRLNFQRGLRRIARTKLRRAP